MSDAVATPEAGTDAPRLPLDQIAIQPGFNPRRYRSDEGMASLQESIAAHGLIEPVIVRPTHDDDGYWIVAGDRRYRACKALGLTEIPALVRHYSDNEALAVAVDENDRREDMSVAEEARLARRVLSSCEGDPTEAAKILGWSAKRLRSRLALLHATDAVLDALEARRIDVGHAELLATVPAVSQEGTLEAILANGYSVRELKDKIGNFCFELAHARFDTAGCQGCPHNSSTQAELFGSTVGGGRCSDHACWHDKTAAHIEAVRAELADTHNAVYLDREQDETKHTRVTAEGADGVGAEQLQACQQCRYHGALVVTAPGQEGAVRDGRCFNLACHAKMVKARQQAEAEAAPKATETTQTNPSQTPVASGTAQAKRAATPSGKSGGKGSARTQAAAAPKAVTERAQAFVRRQAGQCYQQDDSGVISEALSLYGLFQLADATDERVKKALTHFASGATSPGSPDLLAGLMAASEADRAAARRLLCLHLLMTRADDWHHAWQTMARNVCRHSKLDASRHAIVDRAFLKAHTKQGMSALLVSAGFDAWYDEQHGDGAFKRLMKQKVDTILDTVFPSEGGFDFTGFVPEAVTREL